MNESNEMAIITTGLKERERRLERIVGELAERHSAAKAELKSVRNALRELTPNGSKAGGKPSPSKEDVAGIVRSVLQSRELELEALLAEVGRQLTAKGFAKRGLTNRLREVLGTPEFDKNQSGSYRVRRMHEQV